MDFSVIIELLDTPYSKRFGEIMLACFLGGLIGLEREHRGQAAGFRTNMIISVGACLLMQLSIHIQTINMGFGASSVIRIDPGRIASYAIASMGFLGAGTIIKGKGSIRGLTTAASMWLITAIGLCIGASLLYPAMAVTCVIMLILYLFPYISKKIRKNRYIKLILNFSDIGVTGNEIAKILYDEGKISVQNTSYSRCIETNEITFVFNIIGHEDTCMQDVSDKLMVLKDLKNISFDMAEVP
ncbi:MAG: MgtC/SapB family protein [Desulfobacterales bacterium]|nr:MgtC/SapB family protein [Desulfobacterales bacterium]MCP4161784.1 MgtC/SapB family protein [Deltaproteobacteria bacterium]